MLRRICTNLFFALSILLLLSLTGVSAQDYISLAVLDLQGRGISAIEAASLTDRIRSELVRTGGITVVERGQMEQILSEQDFQLSGCTSDECAVEVGQLLGVTTMLAGSIGKVGTTFSIDLRTIDVQTGKIIHSIIHDYRGEIDGLLSEMALVADELVNTITAREQTIIQSLPLSAMSTYAFTGHSVGIEAIGRSGIIGLQYEYKSPINMTLGVTLGLPLFDIFIISPYVGFYFDENYYFSIGRSIDLINSLISSPFFVGIGYAINPKTTPLALRLGIGIIYFPDPGGGLVSLPFPSLTLGYRLPK